MKPILSISLVVAALACSSVKDKQECGVSTDCPVGQYCAHAGGEARCWADSVSPVVGTVTASCTPSPCVRDGVLHVEADVTDDAEVLDATVALDFASGSPIALAPSGGKWVANVQLRGLPFPAYSRNDVVATVTARDGARNASNAEQATGIGITRLRWTYDAGAPLTSPAVMADGTAVVGVSAASGQVLAVSVGGSKKWGITVGGTAFVTAAPAVGDLAIWAGSEDGTLHAVELDGSAVKSGVGVNTGGAIKGSVAVLPGIGKEWAFATSNAGFVGVTSTSSTPPEYAVAAATAFSSGPAIGLDSRAYAPTTSGFLRTYRLIVSPVALADAWTPAVDVGGTVTSPLAIDASGSVWTGTIDGKLAKTIPSDATGTTMQVVNVSAWIVGSPVILANGDVVVGDVNGLLHRIGLSGAELWSAKPNLQSPVEGPLVLLGGDAMLLVPAGGKIFALRGDGSQVWSGMLESGTLRAANLFTPPGQTGNVMSTAYLTSSSGKLYAVIVDGQLDASAPWPKAFHDPRNTNRAGPQP